MNRVKEHANCPRKTKASCKMLPRIAGCAVALIAGVFTARPAWALESCPLYPTTISACCVADRAGGIYSVAADLTAAGNCIKISAPYVVFELNGNTIHGAGTGIGFHVLSTAAYAFVINNTGDSPWTVVEDFSTGVKVDAPHAYIGSVEADFNGRGLVFNGRGDIGNFLTATGNIRNGIVVTSAARDSHFFAAHAESNFGSGIVLNQTTGVTLLYSLADSNKAYGMWLKGASYNSLIGAELEGNGIAGAYLGCETNFARPTGCKLPASAHNGFDVGGFNNLFTIGSCPNGRQANQPYGIVIDRGNGHNHVISVHIDPNPNCPNPGDTVYDGYDGNGDRCRGNVWLSSLPKVNHLPGADYSCMQ